MRDPDATLEVHETHVTRTVKRPIDSGHFLNSALARDWVSAGKLVPFDILDATTVQSEKIPFVSQPTEWCDAQLHDAARLTLELQRDAVDHRFDMKDASAWNILYAGARPVFCDLFSFALLSDRKWWAAGQFARHFILPLALNRVRGQHTRTTFQISRDGLNPEDARRLLGPARFLTRFWPAMAGGEGPGTRPPTPQIALSAKQLDAIPAYRRGLHETFSWMLNGARPGGSRTSEWAAYREHRTHYAEGSIDVKRETVLRWLTATQPNWVLDLGCNTGEFSRLAASVGAKVVAVDGDHDAVQALYLSLQGGQVIHPVIASLDDMSGGRGWRGHEHPGLMARLGGQFDIVLMLALLHHLMVSNSIPLIEVARFAHQCTTSWAIVEWVDEEDPQMHLLCAQRQRSTCEFSVAAQRQAFMAAGFSMQEEVALSGGVRRLALLRRCD